MFHKSLGVSLLILISLSSYGQSNLITYHDDVEPIIIQNCAPCHRKNGYGPFELTNYNQVKNKGGFISHVVESKYMPPWKADPEFSTFKNQRVLTDVEIKTIVDWVGQGMTKGTSRSKKIDIPTLNELESSKPDLVLKMTNPYSISDSSIEDFRFFHIPTNLKKDRYLKSIEFVPGSKRSVHHSRIMSDTSNLMSGIDGMSEFDPALVEFQRTPLADEFMYGWVPGNYPILYPNSTGKKLLANTDLILNVHYSPSSKVVLDQSEVHLYFTEEKIEHEIKTMVIRENDISNQPFHIPANVNKTFYVSYRVENELNIVSIMPHMHFLGKSIKALAITPSEEVIPLIKIDDWDFNWQSSYLLDEPLIIPANSLILVTAEYDNTSNNRANPNDPPIDVGYGWNSTNEMMNMVFYYYSTE